MSQDKGGSTVKKQPEITDATRKAILDAFWTLYQQKPVDKISIKELADLAHIHRSTFYRYFTDIYDLLGQLEEKVLSEISATLNNIETSDFTDLLYHAESIVAALKEYAPLIYHLTGPNGDANFRSKLRERMRLRFSSLSVSRYPSLTLEYLFSFVFSCILSNLNFWYEHQEECSLEQVCGLSKQLISDGMLMFVKNTNT